MKKSSAQGSEDPILQWVTFRLDNETYGINVMQVHMIRRYFKSLNIKSVDVKRITDSRNFLSE